MWVTLLRFPLAQLRRTPKIPRRQCQRQPRVSPPHASGASPSAIGSLLTVCPLWTPSGSGPMNGPSGTARRCCSSVSCFLHRSSVQSIHPGFSLVHSVENSAAILDPGVASKTFLCFLCDIVVGGFGALAAALDALALHSAATRAYPAVLSAVRASSAAASSASAWRSAVCCVTCAILRRSWTVCFAGVELLVELEPACSSGKCVFQLMQSSCSVDSMSSSISAA